MLRVKALDNGSKSLGLVTIKVIRHGDDIGSVVL